ncbi:hypothetical protein EYB26_002648 [Talaromyces marneffei]|uniref:uncharacterized protein n=1 Tax=Talaromyces marneffei TaxID=37727 RepID=UPI0012AA3842|nr:uncharacterized protein EYB26_002648 [Talaromyces marneffei]QGA14992.1 hypothetical protein EYB26_002648 [Talaromyces marneffei]
MTEAPAVLRPRISKSCDECKARKVRCIRARPDTLKCNNCLRRDQTCHFSQTKRKLKVKDSEEPSSRPTSLPPTHSPLEAEQHGAPRKPKSSPSKFYIDRLLESRDTHGIGELKFESCIIKAGESFATSSSLAFFSESRIRSLTGRIGHDRLRELIETIGSVINARLNRKDEDTKTMFRFSPITFKGPSTPVEVAPEAARVYIEAYFKHVHPIHPFLDRAEFEQKALSYDLLHHLSSNAAFSALYHTVLAMGAQYTEGGSFEAGQGKPWKLYQVALGLFSDILLPRESLVNLQALTAMCIFAQNLSCIQIEQTLISEAARMAGALGYNRATMNDSAHRNFWVVYILEKTFSFFSSVSSIISDRDIGCPIPEIQEAVHGGVDWFYLFARFARLVSGAYDMLYTVSATTKTPEEFYESIDMVYQDLEKWRLSVPKDLRPGDPFRPESCNSPWTITVSLRAHFFYTSLIMSLCRLTLHLGAGTESPRIEEAKKRLMYTARHIIELTHYIDMQPHTSIWILGVMPLSALFVLFDFVVHNPYHPETSTNLTFLDVVGAYFTRLEFSTGGSLPSSLMAEFALIARQFMRDIQLGNRDRSGNANSNSQYQPPTEEKDYSEPIKPYNQTREVNQALIYQPPQMPRVEHMPATAHQVMNGASMAYVDQLFYPTDDLQPFMTSELGSGFDMTGLFDTMLPNFQL